MNKVLKELALWKNRLCPHELMEFKRGLLDRINKMFEKRQQEKGVVIMPEEKSKELQEKDELEKTGKISGQRSVDIIRKMNPGKFLPTGAELAKMMKQKE